MEWLTSGNDEPMYVQRIHKNRILEPFFKSKAVENMVNVPLRPDDILVCSYPKSGCHWVWENIRMILAGDILKDNVEKEEIMMERFDDNEDFEKFASPRILNNHAYFDDQPADLLKGQTKLVFIYRNPKDLCVSFYYHLTRIPSFKYNGKFNNYIHRFLQGELVSGSCFEYWNMWEQGLKDHPNIPHLVVRYEDLHLNPIAERRRLASFLGRQCNDEFLQKVTDATSIDFMRQHKARVSPRDSKGQPVMYRKGKIGDWKNYLSANENEMFDQIVDKQMGNSEMFKFIYSFDENKNVLKCDEENNQLTL